MDRRSLLAAFNATLLGATLPFVGTARAADTIKVGVFQSSSALPFYIAASRGYFKEVDINVEAIPFATHPLIVQSMVTGAIEAASNLVTLEGANINARRPGTLSFITLGGQNAQYATEAFVVRANSPAKTLKDLKGMKLLSAPGPANIGAAKAVLKKVGLEDVKDYTIQEQQIGVQLGALQAGTFDGGYVLEPLASLMVAQGIVKRIESGVIATYLLGDPKAEAYAAGCALSDTFIKDKPDVAKRFAQAFAKGIKDAKSDPSAREYLSGQGHERAGRRRADRYARQPDAGQGPVAGADRGVPEVRGHRRRTRRRQRQDRCPYDAEGALSVAAPVAATAAPTGDPLRWFPQGTHITVRGLTKKFDGVPLYERFDLDIPKAKIVSVFGPNGCGKSTLINMMSGIMPYESRGRYCSTASRMRRGADRLRFPELSRGGFSVVAGNRQYSLSAAIPAAIASRARGARRKPCLRAFDIKLDLKRSIPIRCLAANSSLFRSCVRWSSIQKYCFSMSPSRRLTTR